MSKFKVWIDSPIVGTNIQSAGTFENDNQRTGGFTAGTSSSAIRVNTALRQANLVTTALMNLVNNDNLSVESSVTNVQSALNTYFSGLNVASATDSTNATNVTTNINGKAISTIFESNGTTVKNATSSASATDASNVTSKINNKNISSIFESNGTTVKKASVADYATSDTSLGTINTRINTNKTNINNIINGTTPVSVKKSDGTMAQITEDSNGILRYGDDEIISRKKLIWSGSSSNVRIQGDITSDYAAFEVETQGTRVIISKRDQLGGGYTFNTFATFIYDRFAIVWSGVSMMYSYGYTSFYSGTDSLNLNSDRPQETSEPITKIYGIIG